MSFASAGGGSVIAEDFPYGHEQGGDHWADDYAIEAKQFEAAQRRDEHDIIGHARIASDQDRAQDIVDQANHEDTAEGEKQPLPEATPNPGNVHLCLKVADAQAAWRLAVACGARPVVPDGPVDIDGGPNLGAKAAYLRIHDGITLELFQPPRVSAA